MGGGLCGVVLSAALLGLFVACTAAPANGTITVLLTGAGVHDGQQLISAVAAHGADMSNPANILANSEGGAGQVIAAGTVTELMVDTSVFPAETVIFPGGNSYDIGAMIDVDGSLTQNSGDYVSLPLKTVVVDGNMTVEFVYPTDFDVVF